MVAPTRTRRYIDPRSHMPPQSMLDNTGANWLGTSRVVDRPARRKRNRASWRRLLAEGRRETMAAKRAAEAVIEAERAERAA